MTQQYNYNNQMKKQNIYIYPLEAKVIFPYHQYRFAIGANIYNPDYYDNLIGFVTKLEDTKQKAVEKIEGLSRYGTLLKIQKFDSLPRYSFHDHSKGHLVNYLGITFARFKVISLTKSQSKIIATVQIFPDQMTKDVQAIIDKKSLLVNFKKELKSYYEFKLKHFESQIYKDRLENETSIAKMVFKAIDILEISFIQKLKFLQMNKYEERLEFLLAQLTEKTENVKGVISLEEKVRQEMNKQQKKKIFDPKRGQRGYGGYSPQSQKNDLNEKINSKKLPQNVRIQIENEMKNMGSGTSKAVSQKYIETLLEIPWLESSQQIKDISRAEKILNQDHTGLLDVKERILQFLSVKFRNGNSKGNIICLHGPPGVGKTSIAKSIAKAMGRQFTRVSLGGMNDQAELRGHRRTYVAALPGVIIRALIKAKSNNPIILLDQIQKIGRSHKGDPQHALLQILDPSQNNSFVDHYIGIPVDLSKVMFICTANTLELSGPLLNRLQLIQVPGYSREEKYQIAKNHLLPLQIKENGVEGLIQFEDQSLREIIRYSSEFGVRELQRKISKICRKVARKGAKQKINLEKVQQYLGKRHTNQLWSGVGVVNGMAWTSIGGKVLTVEAIQYRSSRQKIQVTGQLGDVMKQSVNIAFSWIKSNLDHLEIMGNETLTNVQKTKYLQQISLHIHFPQGATKKDGPSAGVTIVTCLVSLLLKMPVRQHLSMTGQITLSGKVLPVGGIRQKCIAAIYEGIKNIIIPYGNLKDLDKIDPELRSKAQFYPVKDLKEVLAVAFPNILQRNTPKL